MLKKQVLPWKLWNEAEISFKWRLVQDWIKNTFYYMSKQQVDIAEMKIKTKFSKVMFIK